MTSFHDPSRLKVGSRPCWLGTGGWVLPVLMVFPSSDDPEADLWDLSLFIGGVQRGTRVERGDLPGLLQRWREDPEGFVGVIWGMKPPKGPEAGGGAVSTKTDKKLDELGL